MRIILQSSALARLRRFVARACGLGLLLLALPSQSQAVGGGTSNADFLKIGVGARPTALGDAFSAAADDVSAINWNPAGLALVRRSQISLMHMTHLADISFENASMAMPLTRYSGWGASFSYLWQPPFDSTKNTFGAPTQSPGTASDLGFSLGFAQNLGNYRTTDFNVSNISVGGSLRVIQRRIQDLQATALLADIGTIVEIFEGLRASLLVQNIGTTATFVNAADNSPVISRLGLAWTLAFSDANRLMLVYDVAHPIDVSNSNYNRWIQSVGAEYWLMDALALRGGWKFGVDLGGMTAGAGFKWSNMGVDYAFVPYSILGNTHRISLNYAFGSTVSRPEVSAPVAPRGLSGAAGNRFVSLAWESSLEKDVIGYNVYYTKQSGVDYVRTNVNPEPRKTSLQVTLKNDQTYYFVVTAVNAAGKESEYSKEVSITPRSPARPNAPQSVKTEVQGRTVTLSWKGIENREVIGYNVYYSRESGKEYRKLTKGAPLPDPECRLKGLTAGAPYYFVVTSVTKEGLESDYSQEAFARPKQETLSEEQAPPANKKREPKDEDQPF